MSESNDNTRRVPNQALQEARSQHRWTQQDVANYVGTTVVNVSRWERGITSPNPYFRRQLCILFKKDAAVLGATPVKPDSQREISFSAETISPSLPEPETVQAASVSFSISWFQQRRFPTQQNILAIIILATIAFVVMISTMPIYSSFFSSPEQTSYTTTSVQASPPDPYENTQIDGWNNEGHFLRIQDSSNVIGQGGAHTLQTVFSSRNGSDMPYISVNPHSHQPRSGQTLSDALFVSLNISTTIQAKLYVQDSHYSWHMGNLVLLTNGKWKVLNFLIPSCPGPIKQVGVQFLSYPYNVPVTVYADTIHWQ